MKCIITGGAGFIGSHLCELLLNNGHQVKVLDNLISGTTKNLITCENNNKFKFIKADIRQVETIREFFCDVDWVFHLAGIADIVPSIENPLDYFNTNVVGTLNVLNCAKESNVKRFIYAASSSSYGIPNIYPTNEAVLTNPQHPYALTKHMGEELVLHWAKIYGISALSLRLFNVYGLRSRTSGAYGAVFGVFLAQKINNHPLTIVGDGSQTRDFTHVTDVAYAFYEAAKTDLTGEAINVGSGNHYSVKYLADLLGGPIQYIPKRPGEPDCTYADISKIKKLLGWKPKIVFEDGVAEMVKNIQNWKDAPVWNVNSIEVATKNWFKYLG
ncbi:SDR family oxidoreductase [Polynucleobacter sp. HIN8]|uniref:SDR family oxidoreductase n=1 Tax=Polynucleobacter sp. HIN8 TaxID=3047867 RepID=UPI00257239D2|nr:SDR family oxidoreductase [Polynucleobacter sp. HIN8]BEI38356.1 SDR family oxidoreductase [Polynucleobacter sp. HIN8]